jgi:hypothetical protein
LIILPVLQYILLNSYLILFYQSFFTSPFLSQLINFFLLWHKQHVYIIVRLGLYRGDGQHYFKYNIMWMSVLFVRENQSTIWSVWYVEWYDRNISWYIQMYVSNTVILTVQSPVKKICCLSVLYHIIQHIKQIKFNFLRLPYID